MRQDTSWLSAIMNYDYQLAVLMFRKTPESWRPSATKERDLRILFKVWIWKANKANKVWRLASQSHIKARATTQVQYLVSAVILLFYTVLYCAVLCLR